MDLTDVRTVRLSVGPWGDSIRQVPHDLFVLARGGKIDHREFFLLAVLHEEAKYQNNALITLSLNILSERTAIPVRSLVRVITDLCERKYLIRRSSGLKGPAGYRVNEYQIDWKTMHRQASMERRSSEQDRNAPSAVGEKRRRIWKRCETCGQWTSSVTDPATAPVRSREKRMCDTSNDSETPLF